MGSLYCLSSRAINRRRFVFADNTAQQKEKADETEGMDLPEHFNDKAVVLIIAGAFLFIGALPIWPYNKGEGYFSAIYSGILLAIAIVLVVTGVI
jgi:VIT1/CCC1 family predicted Fe2+/Mn2+ transporter